MTATATLISGPSTQFGGMKSAVFSVAFTSTYPTGGEPINFTTEANGAFSEVHGIISAGNDTLADNAYSFEAVLPAAGTAASSSNTLISLWVGTAGVKTEFTNGGDHTAVGDLKIVVFGK